VRTAGGETGRNCSRAKSFLDPWPLAQAVNGVIVNCFM
jgi:hypothetical protein